MPLQYVTARLLLLLLILLITTTHVLSVNTHYDHTSNIWDHHSTEDPFLTLWNIPIKSCVEECQLRKACRAVNYCRTRRSCQLLDTDTGDLSAQNVSKEFNVFVRKSDIRLTPSQALALSACSSCTINQTCVPHNSSCIVTECRKLNVANGVILGNMVNVGARLKVVCYDLYKLDNVSQDQTVCRADGQWLPAITCVPDTECGPPPTVDGATFVTFTNVSDVIHAVYECDVGYDTPSALNVMSVECLSNNTWGAIGFECLAVCDSPPEVTLATVSAGENLHGFTKTYTCDSGHAVNGSANITCQPDATWSPIQFECIVDCGPPDAIANAIVSSGSTTEGSTRSYTCAANHVAQNPVTMNTTCQADGTWSTTSFNCVRDCGIPSAITNADVSAGGTSEGDNRIYTCSTGYVFRNLVTANITCQSDSTWSVPTFDCLWDCGPPPTVADAVLSAGDTVQDVARGYTCNAGFAAIGTTAITCQAGSTWTPVAFSCAVDCGTPPSETNANVQPGDTTEGSNRTYTCDAGYAPTMTTMSITCQSSGTWTPAMFTCLRDCGPPNILTNAQVGTGGTLDGDTRTYSCGNGYVLRNVVTVDTTCQTDGTWSTPGFNCLWDCGPPPTVADSVVSAGDTVQDVARGYTCNTGYAAIGTTTITCQAGSTWSPVAFSCAVDCGTPPSKTNANVQPGDTTEGSNRTYTCDAGYASTTTTMSITCQSSGTWTSTMFMCLRDCGPPNILTNAQVGTGGTLDGDTRTYSCGIGYVLRNVVTVDTTCQSDGTWSTPGFNCLWDCGTPPTMPYGTVSGGDIVDGSTRTYTCDCGYDTTGTPTITCGEGTGWSTPTSTCTELVCDNGWYKICESCYFTPGDGTGSETDVFTARDYCHTFNAYLLQLETKEESDAVASWFNNAYPGVSTWLGMTDVDVEGTWVWMNSSIPVTWTNWDVADQNQPNGGTGQNYGRFRSTGLWSDIGWNNGRQPFCEKSARLP